jgi:hypothetical protein
MVLEPGVVPGWQVVGFGMRAEEKPKYGPWPPTPTPEIQGQLLHAARFSSDSCSSTAGHPRASCSTVTELPLLMVSEEAEEQAHSTRSTSSANPGNSGR